MSRAVSDNPAADMVQGAWIARYDDGSEKISVSFDLTSERLPHCVNVQMGCGGDQWLYIDVADVPWLCARMMLAAEHILARKGDGE